MTRAVDWYFAEHQLFIPKKPLLCSELICCKIGDGYETENVAAQLWPSVCGESRLRSGGKKVHFLHFSP